MDLPTDALQRRQQLHDLIQAISDDDAAFLDELLLRRKARFDILANLPAELTLHVLDQLDLRDFHTCVKVCRRWNHLLHAREILDHLYFKWLPFQDKTSGPRYQDLSLAAAKAHLRTTGQFTFRIATAFQHGWVEPFVASPSRLQVLQSNNLYRDVVCIKSGELNNNMVLPPGDIKEPHTFFYASGVVAWQTDSQVAAILIQYLRQNRRTRLVMPMRIIMESGTPKLQALGNKYVVAVASRKICAWDIDSNQFFAAELPNQPGDCVTQDNYVLILLAHGGLLLWEPSSRLIDLNVRLEPDAMMHRIRHPPLIIHPNERGTIFVVTRSGPGGWPSVHEIAPTNQGYAETRVFQYVPPDLSASSDPSGYGSNILEVRRVDAQGTFQLMKLDLKASSTKTSHRQYLMFNILSKSFSVQSYLDPLEPHFAQRAFVSRVSCIWDGQLISSSDHCLGSRSKPSVVALDQHRSRLASIPTDMVFTFKRHLEVSSPLHYFGDVQVNKQFADIIRGADLKSDSSPVPDYRAIYGFQFACQSCPGACTYEGAHKPSCRIDRASPLPRSAAASTVRDIDYARQHIESYRARHIYMDDDFLVIVSITNYTVYCVDADGRLAAVLERPSIDRVVRGSDPRDEEPWLY